MLSPRLEARRPRLFLAALGAVALVVVSSGFASCFAFAGGRPALSPARGRVLRAEAEDAEVVDVDVEDEEDEEELSTDAEPESVFDGSSKQFSISWYNKTKYKVFSDGMYEIAKTGETGEWCKYFKMPQSEVERRKPKLMFEYFKKIRKWRRKMGMCRYPNGHLKFIVMMKDHPFTREIYGDKYADTPKWIYNKGEVKRKEMVKRARKLELMLRREDEERRLDRLREMGVWTGEPSWHRDAERDMRWRPRHAKGAWR